MDWALEMRESGQAVEGQHPSKSFKSIFNLFGPARRDPHDLDPALEPSVSWGSDTKCTFR